MQEQSQELGEKQSYILEYITLIYYLLLLIKKITINKRMSWMNTCQHWIKKISSKDFLSLFFISFNSTFFFFSFFLYSIITTIYLFYREKKSILLSIILFSSSFFQFFFFLSFLFNAFFLSSSFYFFFMLFYFFFSFNVFISYFYF